MKGYESPFALFAKSTTKVVSHDDHDGSIDISLFSFRKFLDMIMRNSPAALEMVGVRDCDIIYQKDNFLSSLQKLSSSFLSRKKNYYNFLNYSKHQKELFDVESKSESRMIHGYKSLMHMYRILIMGADILTTGRINIYVDQYRDALLDIKENTVHNSEDKLNQLNEHYLNLFNEAYKKSVLPDNADIHSLDNWLEFVYGLNVEKSGFLFNNHLEKK